MLGLADQIRVDVADNDVGFFKGRTGLASIAGTEGHLGPFRSRFKPLALFFIRIHDNENIQQNHSLLYFVLAAISFTVSNGHFAM